MDPDLDRLEREFSVRIDRWVSKQGIFFQMKHSTGVGSLVPKLCALFFRLFIVLLICLAIFWFYLSSRASTEAFKEDLALQIQAGTNAASIEVNSAERYKGGLLNAQLKISNFSLGSSENSFYEDWYTEEETRDLNGHVSLENVRKQLSVQAAIIQPFGIGDGVLHGWSGKKITLGSLHCHLKTGAETDQLAMTAYQSIFKQYESLQVDNILIQDAHIGWGYDISKGEIKGAEVEALKQNEVWKITVKGGTFSHGWLQNTRIKSMNIECHKSGLVKIVSADLRMGDGKLSFDAEIQMQAKPVVKGKYAFEGVEVTDLVGQEYDEWLDGQVKGEGTLDGTLNSLSGVNAITTVTLSAPPIAQPNAAGEVPVQKLSTSDSFLIVRGKFPILKEMQRINGVNSYNLLRLNIGKFIVEQKGGDTIIKDIDVRSDDFLIINGSLNYVWTSLNEKNNLEIDPDMELKTEIENQEGKSVEEPDIALGELSEANIVKAFSGELNMGFIPQVFETYPEILKVYPEDSNTLRVWIPVKMKGEMHEASSDTADKLSKIVQEAREEKENN